MCEEPDRRPAYNTVGEPYELDHHYHTLISYFPGRAMAVSVPRRTVYTVDIRNKTRLYHQGNLEFSLAPKYKEEGIEPHVLLGMPPTENGPVRAEEDGTPVARVAPDVWVPVVRLNAILIRLLVEWMDVYLDGDTVLSCVVPVDKDPAYAHDLMCAARISGVGGGWGPRSAVALVSHVEAAVSGDCGTGTGNTLHVAVGEYEVAVDMEKQAAVSYGPLGQGADALAEDVGAEYTAVGALTTALDATGPWGRSRYRVPLRTTILLESTGTEEVVVAGPEAYLPVVPQVLPLDTRRGVALWVGERRFPLRVPPNFPHEEGCLFWCVVDGVGTLDTRMEDRRGHVWHLEWEGLCSREQVDEWSNM